MQRSKATWIKLGDENTKYFHSVIKQKKLLQAVTQIQDEDQQTHTDPEKIAEIFVQYYKQLLGSTGDTYRRKASQCFFAAGKKLTVDQQVLLIKEYTRKKVKEAI